MTNQSESIEVSLPALIELAIDSWRLNRCLAADISTGMGIRHAARRLNEFLKNHAVEVQDLTGQAYEAGLAIEVIGTSDDSKQSDRPVVIEEMITPIVFFRGKIVRQGQAITRQH